MAKRQAFTPRPRSLWLCFFLMLSISAALRMIRLEAPPKEIFDEIYHTTSARALAEGNRDLFNPWAKAPAGKAYAWNHPPLANMIASLGISALGDRPSGWRITSALMAVGLTALVFFFALEIFGSLASGFLAMFFLSIDGLIFVQSRTGLIDCHLAFFVLLAVFAYLKQRKSQRRSWFFLACVASGAAISVKWTGVFVFGLIALDQVFLLWKRRLTWTSFGLHTAGLIFIPIFIYLFSHIPMFLMNYDFNDFLTLQRQSLQYHLNLKATHAYQATPWQWVLNLRPTWFYVDYLSDNRIANIYNLGNPILFWFGFLALVGLCLRGIQKKHEGFVFLFAAYSFLWMPWLFSPRIMFSYHYTPAVAFLAIGLGGALTSLWQSKRLVYRSLAIGLPVLALAWFVLFYPHLAAVPVSLNFAERFYFLLSTWR